jgi:hypothetical protein
MSQLKVDSIIPRGGLPSGASGGIIQIVYVEKTDAFSANVGSSFVDITGMAVTITPQSSSNKILIMPSVNLVAQQSHRWGFIILRGSTIIHRADAASNRRRVTSGGGNPPTTVDNQHFCTPFLDSPNTTSATTYKLQCIGEGSSTNVFCNRTDNDGDNADKFRYASSMIAMEVGM